MGYRGMMFFAFFYFALAVATGVYDIGSNDVLPILILSAIYHVGAIIVRRLDK